MYAVLQTCRSCTSPRTLSLTPLHPLPSLPPPTPGESQIVFWMRPSQPLLTAITAATQQNFMECLGMPMRLGMFWARGGFWAPLLMSWKLTRYVCTNVQKVCVLKALGEVETWGKLEIPCHSCCLPWCAFARWLLCSLQSLLSRHAASLLLALPHPPPLHPA